MEVEIASSGALSVILLVGLVFWLIGVLVYLHGMSRTLARISSNTDDSVYQLISLNNQVLALKEKL